MKTKYVEITYSQFQSLMDEMGFKEIVVPGVYERIWSFVIVNTPYEIRVFSSINVSTDVSNCMEMSDNIIALMPYLCIINGEKRTQDIMDYGLKSITHLPRSTFKGSRVQTCILEMQRGYKGQTIFKTLPK